MRFSETSVISHSSAKNIQESLEKIAGMITRKLH